MRLPLRSRTPLASRVWFPSRQFACQAAVIDLPPKDFSGGGNSLKMEAGIRV